MVLQTVNSDRSLHNVTIRFCLIFDHHHKHARNKQWTVGFWPISPIPWQCIIGPLRLLIPERPLCRLLTNLLK